MKYEPTSFNIWGDNFFVYEWCCTSDQCDIFLKSRSHSSICPYCGAESHHLHSTYFRTLQEMPFFALPTYIHVNLYRYYCDNPHCKIHMFGEQLPFAHGSQRRTDAVKTLVFALSIYTSNEGASCILKQLGIKISNDTIGRMISNIKFIDDPDIEAIGIDDVAIRKGQKYATAIYSMNDHHLIALLEGRDAQVVKDWLSSHKKIKVVTRDRASAYAAAIRSILPNCLQVADRFHLLQNILKELKNIFKDNIPSKIFLANNKVLKENPFIQAIDKIVSSFTYDNTSPLDSDGNKLQFDITDLISSLDDEEREWTLEEMKRYLPSILQESYKIFTFYTAIREDRKANPYKTLELLAYEYNISVNSVKSVLNKTEEEVWSWLHLDLIHDVYTGEYGKKKSRNPSVKKKNSMKLRILPI